MNSDLIYRVTFDDGSMCHTGHKPLADVWAKRQGSKLEEIEIKNPTRLRIVNSVDSVADAYERAFTGANRTAATWAAFQAGWNAAKPSDQAIYGDIAERYFRDTATGEPARNPVANHAETSGSPIATVYDPYDTPGIQWHCQRSCSSPFPLPPAKVQAYADSNGVPPTVECDFPACAVHHICTRNCKRNVGTE